MSIDDRYNSIFRDFISDTRYNELDMLIDSLHEDSSSLAGLNELQMQYERLLSENAELNLELIELSKEVEILRIDRDELISKGKELENQISNIEAKPKRNFKRTLSVFFIINGIELLWQSLGVYLTFNVLS